MKLVHIIDTDQNMWIDVDVFFQQSEMELIREELELMGISTPKYLLHAPYKTVINSILSAKFGYAVGNNINEMVSVAHNLMEHHPAYIKHFMLTLKVTGKLNLLNERDSSGKWKERYKKYTQQPEDTKIYKHDLNLFIEFLVPEFEGRLISWGESNELYTQTPIGGAR